MPEFYGPHKKERLKLFCESCKVAICRDCKLGEHLTHLTKELTVSSTEAKEKIIFCKNTKNHFALNALKILLHYRMQPKKLA